MIETAVAGVPELQGRGDDAARRAHRHDQRLGRDRLVYDGKFFEARTSPELEILDRVGGGDSFASGLIYGLLTDDRWPRPSSTAPPTARSP